MNKDEMIEKAVESLDGDDHSSIGLYSLVEAAFDAVWPEIEGLQATILEYEHALQHAVDPHPVPGAPPHDACPDCQRLCQSALDGGNRQGFLEMVQDGA